MSSDSDDDLEKFRAAVDPQFTAYKTEIESKLENPEKPRSLRPNFNDNEDEAFNRVVKTTRKFREHVSKGLDRVLEKQIKFKNQINENVSEKQIDCKSGVKLFRSSSDFIKICESEIKRRRRLTNSEQVHQCEDLDKVAITLDRIREEVKHWSKRSKAPIYVYRKTTSGLVLETPKFVRRI